MPQAYLVKVAKDNKMSLAEVEGVWNRAAKAAGEKAPYGVITNVFKAMIKERLAKSSGKAPARKTKSK